MAEQLPVIFEFKANQTFNDFYPDGNEEIIEQLKKSIIGSGEQFIYLWGDKSHGKSHLLHACCDEASKKSINSIYLDLTHPKSTDPELLIGLEDYHLVCLDNIDAQIAQEKWELSFFNFFNQHRDRKHTLVISASKPPKALSFKLPDLNTRINWGLPLNIKPHDDDGKIAALTFKAKQMGFDIAPQVSRFLIAHYDRDLTSMWVMLDKLDWASLAAKRKLTIPFLKQILDKTEHAN